MNEVITAEQAKALPLKKVASVKHLLLNDAARGQLSAVAAKHMEPERMMRVVANAIRTTPKLQQCEPMSFLGALMQCAALGLEPNTIMGHAYLIPFDKSKKVGNQWVKVPEVQLVVGYKGLMALARRSGEIVSIDALIHYDDDEHWLYRRGTNAVLEHTPGPEAGKPLHVYAIAHFKDGGHAYVVLPWAKVIQRRDGSQGWQQAVRNGATDKSPWSTHIEAMAKKTAIRELAKNLPMSVELNEAVAVDERKADFGGYARGFQMDPTRGLELEPEEGDIEGEAEPAEIEKAPEPVTIEAKAEPVKEKRSTRSGEPYAEMGGQKQAAPAEVEKPAPAPAADPGPDRRAALSSVFDRIVGEMLDGASEEDMREAFAAEIAAMKAEAPDLYTKLEAEFEGFAPARELALE